MYELITPSFEAIISHGASSAISGGFFCSATFTMARVPFMSIHIQLKSLRWESMLFLSCIWSIFCFNVPLFNPLRFKISSISSLLVYVRPFISMSHIKFDIINIKVTNIKSPAKKSLRRRCFFILALKPCLEMIFTFVFVFFAIGRIKRKSRRPMQRVMAF